MSERPPSHLQSDRSPPDELLAAEHALGLLEGAERADALRRRLADPTYAREVEAWEIHLAGLAATIAPVAPPSGLWPKVAEQLPVVADDVLVLNLRRRLTVWRAATGVASTVAACLVAALVWPRPAPLQPPSARMLAARLSASARGPTVFVALYDPARRAIVLTPAQVNVAAGRSPELWLIPPGGKPVALGMANFGASVQLVSTQATAGLSAGALAVSLEPSGGSPTGQPTGPVIATGQLSRL